METLTRAKRPPGRPRRTGPPPPSIHIPLDPVLKANLERCAKEGKRTIRKEIELRIKNSYLQDEIYGGPKMASMFRYMADAAKSIERKYNALSTFENFEVFIQVENV